MKRPMLVSGLAAALSCAIFVLTGWHLAVAFALTGALVLILYFIKPLKLKEKIIIPAICISVIASSLSFIGFYKAKIQPVLRYENCVVSISGKVTDLPATATDKLIKFTLKADSVDGKKENIRITVYAPIEYKSTINPYDYVSIDEALFKASRSENGALSPSSLSDGTLLEADAANIEKLWECEKTPFYYCLKLKQALSDRINAFLPSDEAGFLNGMLFGDKATMSNEDLNNFRAGGIAHLLAVSGLHTSLWCGFLISLLTLLKVKERVRCVICILFLCCFCVITAFTPSVLRASLMMAVTLIAPLFLKRQDSLNSLGLAVSILLLTNPYIIASVSFQLSVTSTLGVIIAQAPAEFIIIKTDKLKSAFLKRIINYFSSNLLISAFAGIFTLPLSAWYFGVFSLVAPLTNILCVKIAFWGMMAGFISILISFIPVFDIQTVSIFLFKITSFLLNTVTTVTAFLTDFRFATIPVFEASLIAAVSLASAFSVIIFILYKRKKTVLMRISSVVALLCVITSILLPCFKASGTRFTVHNAGNGIFLTIRSGLSYSAINLNAEENTVDSSYLPRATCEEIDFLYIYDKYEETTINQALFSFSPEETVINSHSCKALESRDAFPENTIISDDYNYQLNNEIKMQIIDTYTANYVIIEGENDCAVIYDGEKDGIPEIFEAYGAPRILVLTEDIPESLPKKVEALIISADSDIIFNTRLNSLKNYCDKLILTAEKEAISWHF